MCEKMNELNHEKMEMVIGGRGTPNSRLRIIPEECVGCGSCAMECAIGAIYRPAGAEYYVINQEICINCGGPCADCCPTRCVVEW